MTATVLSQGGFDTTPESTIQDPDSGEIVRVWSADSDIVTPGIQKQTIKCICKGIISKTTRGSGTAQTVNAAGILVETDFVLMSFLPNVIITKRDKITDISSRNGVVLWKEEEHTGLPTVFNVSGVTPMFDAFGNHIGNHAMLIRSEVQQ